MSRETADVVIENLKGGTMARYGLGYDDLKGELPALISCSVTPFGQTGPYADWNGYDLNAYHLTGTGSRYCGRPGEAPLPARRRPQAAHRAI